MTEANGTSSEAAQAERLNEISFAFVTSRCVHEIAEHGIADLLDDSPMTAAQLASKAGLNTDALERVMRLLSRYGIFEERERGFAHTTLSRLLRTDHPQSQRPWACQAGSRAIDGMFRHLDHSLATGESAASKLDSRGFFAFLMDHPEQQNRFNAAMTSKSRGDVAAILRAYDFSEFRTIGDIGGGHGHLVSAILKAAPQSSGVLFDQPQMVQQVADMASDRLKLVGGDFFNDALPVCDAYTLMNIIHDWNDEQSIAILKAVRKAAPQGSRLLLIEMLLPEQSGSPYALLMDISMLVITGGRERKLSQYEALLAASGWALQRVIRTDASIAIIESVAG